jgi:Flp pilus assembly protein TadG
MQGEMPNDLVKARGFMAALARDVRGNTLAIMAAALIPLAGLVGGGIDISRMYITKTRLQHACDAGALAGRKSQGGGTWDTGDNTVAQQFFDANYMAGAYGSSALTRSFSENAGKVSGTASATLPMTIMRILGKTTDTLSVTCDAEMKLPNTDVMFVLDNTGSMGSKAVSTDTQTKMEALKVAVKCFYEIVAHLDTDAACATGTPSGGTSSQVQIRFGFMPYSTNVNVGKLLPNTFLADSWSYQTRVANWNPTTVTVNGPYWQVYGSAISQSDCLKYMNNTAFTGFTPTATSTGGPNPTPLVTVVFNSDGAATQGGNSGEWGYNGAPDTSGTSESCRRKRTDTTTTYVPSFKDWTYKLAPITVSGLKAGGSSWNNSIQVPVGSNGTNTTIGWDGCIEERPTVRAATYYPIPSGAKDLDIDLVPSTGDSTTQWGPALPDAIFLRNVQNYWSEAYNGTSTTTTGDYYNGVPYYCPAQAVKLQAWPDASAFDTYVDSLVPTGNTYHDIGILWGARFMSPTGIFASENATTPGGADIQRHMIFMTDGDAVSAPCDYTAYGVAFWDQRTTTDVSTASNCPNEYSALDDQVNNRFIALCSAVKNKNITLWVISFGSGSNTTTEARLSSCASTGKYFTARNSATLQTTFQSIANQISQLRLTK